MCRKANNLIELDAFTFESDTNPKVCSAASPPYLRQQHLGR